jgi:Domain of unknown function (DUF1996)
MQWSKPRRRYLLLGVVALIIGTGAVPAAALGRGRGPAPKAAAFVAAEITNAVSFSRDLMAFPLGALDPYLQSGLGEFVAHCPLTHRAAHDPIVGPGNANFWHSHDFFGNVSTNHLTTVENLDGQATSCSPTVDDSAYWVPTLLKNGVPIDPTHITIYYQVKRPYDPTKVMPFPHGLRMIAGDAMAMSAQPDYVEQWHCIGTSASAATIPDCGNDDVELVLTFPNCWDGVHLDSANHKSHMFYGQGLNCPVTHPVLVPEMSFRFRWSASGPGVTLSSDTMSGHTMPAGTTAHGDFINTWDDAELARRVSGCLNVAHVCNEAGSVIR